MSDWAVIYLERPNDIHENRIYPNYMEASQRAKRLNEGALFYIGGPRFIVVELEDEVLSDPPPGKSC